MAYTVPSGADALIAVVRIPGVRIPGVRIPGVRIPGVRMPGVRMPGVYVSTEPMFALISGGLDPSALMVTVPVKPPGSGAPPAVAVSCTWTVTGRFVSLGGRYTTRVA